MYSVHVNGYIQTFDDPSIGLIASIQKDIIFIKIFFVIIGYQSKIFLFVRMLNP
jgi:hypothetical protein